MEPDSNPILEIIQRRVKQHKKKMMESAQEGYVSSDVMNEPVLEPVHAQVLEPVKCRKKKAVKPLQESSILSHVERQKQGISEQVGELAHEQVQEKKTVRKNRKKKAVIPLQETSILSPVGIQEQVQKPVRRRKKKIVIPPQETSILSPVEGQEPIQEQEGQVHKPSFVYLLESSDKRSTYIGATIDLDHRLRQHNKELVGGAKATSIKVEKGCTWHRVLYVAGFPTWQAALQFEWRFKRLSSTKAAYKIKNPLERRLYGLRQLLALPASTSKAVPYAQWPSPPVVIWEPVLNMTREL